MKTTVIDERIARPYCNDCMYSKVNTPCGETGCRCYPHYRTYKGVVQK